MAVIDNTSEDYKKLWNQFKQWIVDYELAKKAENIWLNDYKSHSRYCIAISTNELLEKMTEFEKNGGNNGQIQSKKWAKSGQKVGTSFC